MTQTEIVPTATSVMDEVTVAAFDDMLQRRQQLKQWINEHETEVENLDSAILSLLTEKGCPKIKHEKYSVTLVANTKSFLNKLKLIENGVDPAVIAASTVKKSYDPYVLVNEEGKKRKKEKWEGREED